MNGATNLGDDRTAAFALLILGVVAWYSDDGPRAQALYERALELCRSNGDEWAAAKLRVNLADVAEGLGQYERAASLLADALRTNRNMGDNVGAVYCVEAIAELRLRAGLPSHAARLLTACQTYRNDMALPLDHKERELRDALIDQARLTAGSIAFAIAETEGSTMTLDDAAEEALLAIS